MGKYNQDINVYLRELNTGKEDIMLMGGNVHGDREIDLFHSLSCYVLTMKNHGKVF